LIGVEVGLEIGMKGMSEYHSRLLLQCRGHVGGCEVEEKRRRKKRRRRWL